MTDPYRISATPSPASAAGAESRGLFRPVLWVVLVVSTAANVVTSSIGLHPLVGASFGAVTLGCIAALIIHHYRHRRSH
jgi:hypothetical protein